VLAFAEWLVDFVHHLGYVGIFIATFLESTFVPLPAEVTMIPAGYLVYQGTMSGGLVLFLSIIGSVTGSAFNYYIAYHYGRKFLDTYGKYMFFDHHKMEKLDRFFATHGEISILTGRLIPGLRHFISFPAGLWKMHLNKFVSYTAIGAGIWMTILLIIGYVIGGNKELVKHYTPLATIMVLSLVILALLIYVRNHRKTSS